MIVLSEASSQLPPSASARDLHASTEAARLAGCHVYSIAPDFTVCGDAINALWHIPSYQTAQPAVWIGYIPTFERYKSIYDAAYTKGIVLLNSPEEHRQVQEFDLAYPLLRGLTPESLVLQHANEVETIASQLGFPVFVKGAVQSRKARGWKACVAENREELIQLSAWLLDLDSRSRGRVIVRKLVRLRHSRTSGEGFPLGREYRVFLYRQRIIGLGYYWEGEDPLKPLSADEQDEVESLALEVAKRMEVPYLAVDIGQSEDGEWIVIETGDPQFSGVSQIPLLQLWSKINHIAP